MISLLPGLGAGFLHVLSGPDHLAAVAPLAVRSDGRAWVSGIRWGIGHSAGVALVGLASLVLRESLPTGAISAWSERSVGVLLIAIGFWAMRSALRNHVHAHAHSHDGSTHVHLHVHGKGPHRTASGPHTHSHAAFGIGTLHGLAGSSHFLGVLPALAFPTFAQAAEYIGAFAVGTVVAMAGFSSIVGWFASRYSVSSTATYRGMIYASGIAAMGVGVFWIFQ